VDGFSILYLKNKTVNFNNKYSKWLGNKGTVVTKSPAEQMTADPKYADHLTDRRQEKYSETQDKWNVKFI
jgi:hypothetical protein